MYRQLLLMPLAASLVACGDLTVLAYTVDADPNLGSSIDAIRVTINGVDQEPFAINSDEFAVNGGDGVTFTITPGSRTRDVEVEVSGLSQGIVRGFDGELVTVEGGRTLDRELRLIPSDFAITNSPGNEMQLSTNVGRGGGQIAVIGDQLLVSYVGSDLECQQSGSCLAIGQVLDFQGQPVATALVGQDDPASPFILNGAGGPPPDPAVAGSDTTAAIAFRTDSGIQLCTFDAINWSLTGSCSDANQGGLDHEDPAIAALGSGNYVVVWSQLPNVAGEREIMARRFTSTGAPLAAPIIVSANTPASNPSVDAAGTGESHVVSWTRGVGGGSELRGAMFDSAGAILNTGGDIAIGPTYPDASISGGDVAGDNGTGIALATWTVGGANLTPEYFTAAFNVSGVIGDVLSVELRNGSRASRPVVALDRETGIAHIAWSNCDPLGDGSNRGCGVFTRRYQLELGALTTLDDERKSLATTTAGDQVEPSLDLASDGSVAGAWTSRETDFSRVRGRLFTPE